MNRLSLLLVILIALCSVNQSHAASAEQALLKRITAAEKQLAASEKQILRERKKLAGQLHKLEQEVMQLRDKTAVARRMQDENSLSLDTLKQRLESWKQQQGYQNNLIHRFLQHDPQSAGFSKGDLTTQLQRLTASAKRQASLIYPNWQPQQVILPGGEIESLDTLRIGPVTWFIDPDHQQAGLALSENQQQLNGKLLLDDSAYAALTRLKHDGRGEITFDPTLNRAIAQQQSRESLPQHLKKGGPWVLPILLFAAVALTIALIKAVQLWRLPAIITLLPRHQVTKENQVGMQFRLVEIANQFQHDQERDDQLFLQLQEDQHYLEKWIGAITITAAVSPLLGLLGTVSGMIETFRMMTLFGAGDPEVVSGGIAQALITTEMGLIVAIPSLVVSALLSRRAKSYYQQLENFALTLSRSKEDTTTQTGAQLS